MYTYVCVYIYIYPLFKISVTLTALLLYLLYFTYCITSLPSLLLYSVLETEPGTSNIM